MIRQQSMPQLSQVQMNPPPHFLPGQQQPVQQQQPPNHVALMQNANNPPMGLLGGGAQNNANALQAAARHQMSLDRRQQNAMQQGQNPQINASTAAANMSHMASLGHTPLQAMGFSANMMQPGANGVQVRRVQSHPQGINQSVGHVPSMHPGQQVVNGVNMAMNPQVNIPPHMRQAAQQPMMPRMPASMPGSMSPDLMGRQGNAGGVPQNSLRAPSAQLMNSLSQPSGMPQGGLQQSIPQNSFPQSVPHPHHTPSLTSSSPRPVGHPQQHPAANMMMGTPGSSQPASRTMSHGDNAFMGIPNHQFPSNMVPGSNRIPNNNPSFPFVPPIPQNDALEMPQSMGEGPPNSSNSSVRPSFQPTPAQQFEQLQQNDNFGAQYVLPSQGNPPPTRPPSHPGATAHTNSIPRQIQPHQHSPHQSDPMAAHVQQQPQRPQSQPQGPPGRPPSQPGPSHTPRSSQSQLPPSSGLLPSTRITPHTQPQTSPHQQRQSPSVQQPIAPRPPQGSTTNVPPPTNVASAEGSTSQPPPSVIPRPPVMAMPVGLGQGVIRLLQFSGVLSSESPKKQQLSFWTSLVDTYFTPGAIMKITLWKDNQRAEAKPFEIGVPILPRFFLVTTQSGVKSMTLSLDGARERLLSQQHGMVECVSAVWTYKYANGYTVTLRGPLTVHVVIIPQTNPIPGQPPFTLKFENLQFDASTHEKSIAIESIMGTRTMDSPKTPRVRNAATPSPNGAPGSQRPEEDRQQWDEPRISIDSASIPGEPVNAFGIPQATMRCLELAESVSQMTDLIAFANETKLGPMDALTELAKKLRDGSHNPHHMGPIPVNGPGAFQGYGTPTSTLYSGMSPMTAPTHPVSGSSPQNAPPSAEVPPKQSKPPTSGPAPPAPNQPPAPSQAGLTSTPSMAPASLKRKPNDSNSPITANAEPQSKRTRKQKRNG
ncbi:LIM-domain binding protein-domain-containing protein [Phlebopus sp. FC_14]|nr:LIM-domain binding protein-domain-containing protein [Phlebopus sp. FC_14]